MVDSGYEAYDRLSPAWKSFAETLTATHRNVSMAHNINHWTLEANALTSRQR